jgi:hypothetical protein
MLQTYLHFARVGTTSSMVMAVCIMLWVVSMTLAMAAAGAVSCVISGVLHSVVVCVVLLFRLLDSFELVARYPVRLGNK